MLAVLQAAEERERCRSVECVIPCDNVSRCGAETSAATLGALATQAGSGDWVLGMEVAQGGTDGETCDEWCGSSFGAVKGLGPEGVGLFETLAARYRVTTMWSHERKLEIVFSRDRTPRRDAWTCGLAA